MGLRYLIFALLTAIGLGILAQNKHKSVVGWVLFGLFLPPIALIVALMRFYTGGWDKLSLTERKCPHCLSVIDIRATKCKNCTGDLPLVLLPKREDGSIDCPKCRGSNVRLASGGYYCDDCSKVVAQPTHFGPRIEEEITTRLTTQSVSQPKPISAEEISEDEEVLDLTPDIVKPLTSKEETKKVETIIDPPTVEQTIIQEDTFKISVAVKRVEDPSLKTVIVMPLIYLFGVLPISLVAGFTVGFYGEVIGIPKETMDEFLRLAILILTLSFYLTITWLLMKRYSSYLFTDSWKINFYSHLTIGLKWSAPFIVVTVFVLSSTSMRSEWIDAYIKLSNISLENISVKIIIYFSTLLLVGTFLEELIFRGLIQQYIRKFANAKISVLITAVIFTLGHCFFNPVTFGDIAMWFIAGTVTGFAFNKYNSCISSFVPHLFMNLKYIIIIPLILIF